MPKLFGDHTFAGNVITVDNILDAPTILNRSTVETREDFTISVDPNGFGSPSDGYVILLNQSDSDSYGSFTTVEAALNSIPDHIQHTVTISLADGVTNLDATYPFGDMRRFIFMGTRPDLAFGTAGVILFTSASGLTIEPNTTIMDVTSGSETSLVLDSDPGFADDAYRGAFLEVVAGTGIGQVRGIRAHSGVNFTVPARWNPVLDATSQVEIRTPAAELMSSVAAASLFGNVPMGSLDTALGGIEFSKIDISHASGGSLNFYGLAATLGVGCRLQKLTVTVIGSSVFLRSCVIDAQATSFGGIFVTSGFLRSTDTGEGWLIMDATLAGIILLGSKPCSAFLFQGTIEGCPIGILAENPLTFLECTTRVDGLNTNYGIGISAGAIGQIDTSSTTISGSTSDFQLDGTTDETYAELTANSLILGPIYDSKLMVT